jgi:hypothetical protein
MVCVVAALCAGAIAPASARAGQYEVAVCHDPGTGLPAPVDGMSFPSSGAYADAGVYGGCGSGGYVYAALDGVAPHGPSDVAAWEFTAPAATTISAVGVWRAFVAGPSAPYRSPIAALDVIDAVGSATTVAACSQAYGCVSVGTDPSTELSGANWLAYSGLDASAIEGVAACGGGQTCPLGGVVGGPVTCPELGGDSCLVANHLYAMLVTLDDSSPPSAGNLGGTLVSSGPLTGGADVSFDATDAGSGLYSAAVDVDGAVVASGSFGSNGGRCVSLGDGSPGVLRFDWTVPCPLAASETLAFDTSGLRDGTHDAAVTVTDAAGNTSVVWSGQIDTLNAPQGGKPAVLGRAQVGQMLTVNSGVWSPAALAFDYQWLRCAPSATSCATIPGATGASYTLGAADAYDQLEVAVTATDAAGSTTATSPPSGVVIDANGYRTPPADPALTGGSTPAITGTIARGATLDATPGTWANGPLTYAYQWQRCDSAGLGCTAIRGAAGSTYRVSGADAGARIRVLVSASGPGGTTVATSPPTRLVGGGGGTIRAHIANGAGACEHAALEVSVPSRTVVAGRAAVLRGRLRCGTRPISGATLDVSLTPLGVVSGARSVHVRTTRAGSFAYLVRAGPSRRIDVSYRAFSNDRAPSATAAATLLVRPTISLIITPARTTNGHTITFRGAVSGGDEPAGGLPLEVEYREGSDWMIYDTVLARPGSGRFVWRYTFRRTTESITYTFRVAIAAGGVSGYPYQPAASPPRSVHVDP